MRIPDNFSLGKNLQNSLNSMNQTKNLRSGKDIVISKLTDDYPRINHSSALTQNDPHQVNSIFINQISSSNPNFGKSSEPLEIEFPNQSDGGNSQVMSGGSGLSFKRALPKFTLLKSGGAESNKIPANAFSNQNLDKGNNRKSGLRVIGLENIIESQHEKQIKPDHDDSEDLIQTTESKFVMRTESGGFREISHRRGLDSIPFEKIVEEPESQERQGSQDRKQEDVTSIDNLQKGYQIIFGSNYPNNQQKKQKSRSDSPLEQIQEGPFTNEKPAQNNSKPQTTSNSQSRKRENFSGNNHPSINEDFAEIEYRVDINQKEKDSIQKYIEHDPADFEPQIDTNLSQPNDEFVNSKGEQMDLIEYLDKKQTYSGESSRRASQNPLFKNSFAKNLEEPVFKEDSPTTPPHIFNNNLVAESPGVSDATQSPKPSVNLASHKLTRKLSSQSRSRKENSHHNPSHPSQTSANPNSQTRSRKQNSSSRTHDSRSVQSPLTQNTRTTRSHQLSQPSGQTISKKSKKSENPQPSNTSHAKPRRTTQDSQGHSKFSRRVSKHSYQMGTLEHLENYEAADELTEYTHDHTESSPRSNGSAPVEAEIIKHFGLRKAGTEGFERDMTSEKSVDYLQLSKQHNSSGKNSERSEKIYYFQGAGSDVNENEKLVDFRKNMFRGSDCSEKDVYAVRNEDGGFGKLSHIFYIFLILYIFKFIKILIKSFIKKIITIF